MGLMFNFNAARSIDIRQPWGIFINTVIIFTAFEIPFRLAFDYQLSLDDVISSWLLTALYSIDILINLQSSDSPDQSSRSQQGLARRINHFYLRNRFLIDLITTIPFDLIIASFTGGLFFGSQLLRLLRLIRLVKFSQILERNPYRFRHYRFSRLSLPPFLIVLVTHWIACGWVQIGRFTEGGDGSDPETLTRYIKAMYWTITTLTSVGYGDITPSTNLQRLYAIVVMIVGVGIFGYVISNIVRVLANSDASRSYFMEKMDTIDAFIRYHKIPANLAGQIHQYYEHLWDSRLGYDQSTFLNDLPDNLKIKVSLFLKRSIIQKSPIFQNADEMMIRDIALCLVPSVYAPGDYIVRYGDVANKMYFIGYGSVEVVSASEAEMFAILSEGQFFGETGLLEQQYRNATIRALEYCTLYSLSKDDFDRVVSRYPDFAHQIRQTAKQRAPKSPIPSAFGELGSFPEE